MVTKEEITALIKKIIPDAELQLEDMNGGGDHWNIKITSKAFKGKNMVEQQRLVYSALQDLMKGPIHALKMTTEIPKELNSQENL